jgi:hypothetical protein
MNSVVTDDPNDRTCGNCYWFDQDDTRCICHLPMWVSDMLGILKLQNVKMNLNKMGASETASNCPCWRERWICR